jgi:hypothetical protein
MCDGSPAYQCDSPGSGSVRARLTEVSVNDSRNTRPHPSRPGSGSRKSLHWRCHMILAGAGGPHLDSGSALPLVHLEAIYHVTDGICHHVVYVP